MIHVIDFISQKRKGAVMVLVALFIGIVLWSFTVDTSHAHTWAEKHIPGFWSLFGIGSCTVLIFVSRWFSKSGISREEDYYDN